MIEKVFIQFCEIIVSAAAIGGIGIVASATWYDLRSIAQSKRRQKPALHPSKQHQPSIAVLVYADNNASTIETCLRSIQANDYINYQIIVADNASTDATRRMVAQYRKTEPTLPITLYSKRTATDRLSLLRQAYKKGTASDLVLTIQATDTLSHDLLGKSAAHFTGDRQLQLLCLRPYVSFTYNLQTLISTYISLSRNMITKAIFALPLPAFQQPRGNIIMRHRTFLSSLNVKTPPVVYAADLTYLPAAAPFIVLPSRPYSYGRKAIATLLTGVVTVTMITYFLYTATLLRSNVLLLLSWLVACIWLLAVTWSDDVTPTRTKIELSFATPFMYFVFYTSTILHITVALAHAATSTLVPKIDLQSLRNAIQLELYSTRY